MGKYKKEVTEYVLDHVGIVDVITSYVDLKRAGRNHKGLCPFHGEKTPSFVVSEERNSYHCFGCSVSGNAIGFVMAKENLGFLDALEFLAERYNLDLNPFLERDTQKQETDTKALYEVMRQAARYYYGLLGSSDQAKDYIQKRGISIPILKQFGLGYSLERWDGLYKHLRQLGVTDDQLLKCGLVIKKETGGYYDRFRHRLMFPILDHRGRVVAFGGRVFDDSVPKYLNSPESVIFHKSNTLYGLNVARKHIDKARRIIVVEGYMDTIALHQAGFSNTVATLGTALTEQHARQLKKLYDEVVFAYDGDEAGQNAIIRSLSVLKDVGLRVKVLDLQDTKDPDEYIQRYGAQRFAHQVDQGMSTIDFSLKRLEKGFELTDDDQRLQYLKEAYGLIIQSSSQAERDVYLQNLSQRTGVDLGALKEDFENHLKGHQRTQKPLKKTQDGLREDQGHEGMTHDEYMDFLPGELLEQFEPPEGFSDEEYEPVKKEFAHPSEKNLINDAKLFTIEKAVLKCTLVSRPFFLHVKNRMSWGFYHWFYQRDLEAITGYYESHDSFDALEAIETLPLDVVERLRQVLEDSTHVVTLQDVDKLLGFHHKHYCEVMIKTIDQELQQIKLKPGPEAALILREKMVARIALSKELAQAVKELNAAY